MSSTSNNSNYNAVPYNPGLVITIFVFWCIFTAVTAVYLTSKYDYKIGPYNRGLLLTIFGFLGISMAVSLIYAGYIYFTKFKKIKNPHIYTILLLNRYWLIFFTAILSGILAYIIVSKAIPKSNSFYTLLNNDYVILTIGLCIWLLGPGQMALYAQGYNTMNFGSIVSILGLLAIGVTIGLILWGIGKGKGPIYKYFITGLGFASIFVFLFVLFLISPLAPDGPFQIDHADMWNHGWVNNGRQVTNEDIDSVFGSWSPPIDLNSDSSSDSYRSNIENNNYDDQFTPDLSEEVVDMDDPDFGRDSMSNGGRRKSKRSRRARR